MDVVASFFRWEDVMVDRPDLPRGTVTFLFTDVEGSTALWDQDQVAMRLAVDRPVRGWRWC